MNKIFAYCDGCSLGNPGYAGAGAVLIAEKDGVEIKRTELTTSAGDVGNNVAELMAIRLVAESLTKPCAVQIFTDSANAVGWLSKGWKRKDPSIQALVAEIRAIALEKGITLDVVKVDGHAGVELNERAHQLANQAAETFKAYCATE